LFQVNADTAFVEVVGDALSVDAPELRALAVATGDRGIADDSTRTESVVLKSDRTLVMAGSALAIELSTAIGGVVRHITECVGTNVFLFASTIGSTSCSPATLISKALRGTKRNTRCVEGRSNELVAAGALFVGGGLGRYVMAHVFGTLALVTLI